MIPGVQFAIGGGLRVDVGQPHLSGQVGLAWVAIATIAAASVIRWLFLPTAADRRQMAMLMAIGLGLSGAVEFYSVFLFGADAHRTKMTLSALSLLSVIQFAPIYAANRKDG
jgi:hypothetical protein